MRAASDQSSPRWQTARAAMLLALARLSVRLLPLSAWRASLGQLIATEANQTGTQGAQSPSSAQLQRARYFAGRVERAASRLPGRSKCLPQAIALQWLLRREQITSRLVIAIHRQDRVGEHAYHAWVETGGEMLIGHCDRASYSSVASFEQFGRS